MIRYLFFMTALFVLNPLLAQEKETGLFEVGKVKELRLFFEQGNWDHVLDSLKQQGDERRLVGDASFEGKVYKGVGVRYKGNSSFFAVSKAGSSKLPFNIDFNHTHKDQKLPGGVDKVKLSNVFRDPSYIREVLSYEIARRYMPASRANFVQLFVNDVYLGLYNSTESVEDEFLKQHFKGDKGILFKCDPIWGYKEQPDCPKGDKASLQYLGPDSTCYRGLYEVKSDFGWQQLIDLTKILNQQPEKLDSIFNIDQALWMLAFNMVLVNLDSYTGRFCHNYYLYRDKEGVFHPIVWDMNLSFGGFRYDGSKGSPLSNEEMQTLSPFIHYKEKNEQRPLITQLLSESLYRKMYVAHIRTILNDYFVDSTYLRRAEEIQAMIAPYVKSDSNRLYDYEAFEKNLYETTKADKASIIGIAELMEPRAQYLKNHPLVSKDPPVILEASHIDYDDIVAVNARLEGAEACWLFYRYGQLGPWRKLEMFDDSGHDDRMADDGIWGATIHKNKEKDKPIQYYIVAENQYTAALSPERASFEAYSTGKETSAAKKGDK
ncbi:MAG: CotH kinase family protein [Lewinellaceae bacterium]|nr:CotH kinase family protein [Phaeodactylibacter sp.]MCB9038854.1 CotH kinase family protein [Lewinellaceae bacterium]